RHRSSTTGCERSTTSCDRPVRDHVTHGGWHRLVVGAASSWRCGNCELPSRYGGPCWFEAPRGFQGCWAWHTDGRRGGQFVAGLGCALRSAAVGRRLRSSPLPGCAPEGSPAAVLM